MKPQFSLFEGTVHFKDKFWSRECHVLSQKSRHHAFVCAFLESLIVIWRKSQAQEVLLQITTLGVACGTPRCFWPVMSILLGPPAYCPPREGLTQKCGFEERTWKCTLCTSHSDCHHPKRFLILKNLHCYNLSSSHRMMCSLSSREDQDNSAVFLALILDPSGLL